MVTIRRIEEYDKSNYLNLFNQEDFGCIGMLEDQKPSIYTEEKVISQVISKEIIDTECLIIEDEQGFIGYALISRRQNSFYIGEFVIHSSRRKQGFGKKLLDEIIKYASKEEVNIDLECFSMAVPFFKKMGFLHQGVYRYKLEYNPNNQKHKENLFVPYELIEAERRKQEEQRLDSFTKFLKSQTFKSIMDL